MRRTVVVSMIAALFAGIPLHAQQGGQITGTVTSAEGGRPLPGATVSVAGGAQRALTGPDGRYTLGGVAAGPRSVTAAVIGHTASTLPVTVAAGQTATLDFTLQTSAVGLQGVVAIGYGQQRVRDRTGSVATVTPEQFNTGRVVSPEQLIQGKVAGVQVNDTGEPGGKTTIRIRGGTSVNATNEPLFVVDGQPLQAGGGITEGRNPLNFLNPNDIESVTVLKDASATAIYGSRGANGVILVTTRTGARGAQFTYSTSLSSSRITRQADLLTTDQFRSAVAEFAPSNVAVLGTASTDWRGLVERNAGGQEHNLAVSGTGQSMNYRLSLGYLDQAGVLRGTDTRRLSASGTYGQQLFSNTLRLRANVRGSRINDSFTPGSVLGSALSFAPTQPVMAGEGTFFQWADATGPNNPLADLALVQDQQTTFRTLGNVEGSYDLPFLTGLTGTLRMGYDYTQANRKIFNPIAARGSGGGNVTRREPSRLGTVLDAYGRYARSFAGLDSDVDLTAGYSYENAREEYPGYFAQNLQSDVVGANGPVSALVERTTFDVQAWRLASGFARMNWNVKDRYLLTLSVRRDGSSRFGPSNQWGTFPSAAFAWRLSEEPFMPHLGPLGDLKVRASWGVNGNQDFGNYLWVSSYLSSLGTAQAQFGNTFVSTIRPSAVDPNIKWEETTSYNLGLDWGLWDGRITGTVDYYKKDTDDLIFNVPVAAGTNLSNYVTTNIGSMTNRGLELGLNARVLNGARGGLSWDASFNASTNRNRLTRINAIGGGSERILSGGISGGVGNNIQVLQPGAPVYSFFVYRHLRDANGKPVYADTNKDGTINEKDLYQDLNGDKEIDERDRIATHSAAPQWVLGHTSQLGYGNLDASFTLRASMGNYAYNNVASNLGYYNLLTGAAPRNLSTSVLETGFKTAQYFSDVYVEDASYLRMDNLTLGYTFNGVRGVDNMRLFGTVQNVFTLTGYSGVDPMGGLNGIDNNVYPRSRTFTAGVSLAF